MAPVTAVTPEATSCNDKTMARQRRKPSSNPQTQNTTEKTDTTMRGLTIDSTVSPGQWSTRTQWIFFAIASGACAAFNGAFAKL